MTETLKQQKLSGTQVYLQAGAEQQQQAAGGGQQRGAPGDAHAGGGLLPGGCQLSVIVGATLRSGFEPLRLGHARCSVSVHNQSPHGPAQKQIRPAPNGTFCLLLSWFL